MKLKLNTEVDNVTKCRAELNRVNSFLKEQPRTESESYIRSNIQESKKVTQYNKNGDIIANFTSLRHASRKTRLTRYAIKKSCDNPKIIYNKSYFKYTK